MRASFRLLATAIALCASPVIAQDAAEVPYDVLRATDYAGFVRNWEGDAPFCAAASSLEEWRAVIAPGPAPAGRLAAPPEDLWDTNTLIIIARLGNAGGDIASVLQVVGVTEDDARLIVDTRYTPAASASYQIKFWTGISVERPLSGQVDFVENGETICTVQLTAGQTEGR